MFVCLFFCHEEIILRRVECKLKSTDLYSKENELEGVQQIKHEEVSYIGHYSFNKYTEKEMTLSVWYNVCVITGFTLNYIEPLRVMCSRLTFVFFFFVIFFC